MSAKSTSGKIKKGANKQTTLSPIKGSNNRIDEKKKLDTSGITRIIVQYDVGLNNSLFLRGQGLTNLSWDKGLELKNIKPDEWIWETDKPFSNCEFKVLINDNIYEIGENHSVIKGESIRINPKFPK